MYVCHSKVGKKRERGVGREMNTGSGKDSDRGRPRPCAMDDEKGLNMNVNGEELVEEAREGRWDEALGILKAQPNLIRMSDLAGNTVFHEAAASGHEQSLKQLLQLMDMDLNLKEVVIASNGDGDTPLHLALNNRHWQAACLLMEADPRAKSLKNEDGVSAVDLVKDQLPPLEGVTTKTLSDDYLDLERLTRLINPPRRRVKRLALSDIEMELSNEMIVTNDYESCDHDPVVQAGINLYSAAFEGHEDNVDQMLALNPTLIQYLTPGGSTALHAAIRGDQVDLLNNLLQFMTTSTSTRTRTRDMSDEPQPQPQPTTHLTLQRDKDGNTPLHLALLRGHKSAAQNLFEVTPEAAYLLNNHQVSPLYLAVKNGYDDLVRLVFQLMPVSSLSPSLRQTLLSPTTNTSLAFVALKARHFATLQVVMENLPSLINIPDEKGWKLLSYATNKGYLDEIRYFLTTFPESVNKYDVDGSFPIHKAVAKGRVEIIKELISHFPQTLYQVDRKGRTVLHIAVQYAKCSKTDVLSYLIKETPVAKILELKDQQGYTFMDLIKH